MNIHDTLMKSADIIERDGWWRDGDLDPASGPFPACAGNAVYRVMREEQGCSVQDMCAAQTHLFEYLGGVCLGDIWEWNDAEGRTAAEVIETLRAAAAVSLTREAAEVEAVAVR